VEPVVVVVAAGDDVRLIEEQWSVAAIAAQVFPIHRLDWLVVPWLAQEYGADNPRRRRERLFTLNGPIHAAAHVALQVGHEKRTPLRFAEGFGGIVVRKVLSTVCLTRLTLGPFQGFRD